MVRPGPFYTGTSCLIEGNGCEPRQTSKEQTKKPIFMLEVHNLLFCAHALWLNYVTDTFLLVRFSARITHNLLCFVHGQGQESEQKH